jgi:hypothetical protein
MLGSIDKTGTTTNPSTPSKNGTSDPKTGQQTDSATSPSKDSSQYVDPKTPPSKGVKGEIQSKSSLMSKRVAQVNSGSSAKGRTGEVASSSNSRPAKVVYSLPKGMGSGTKFQK